MDRRTLPALIAAALIVAACGGGGRRPGAPRRRPRATMRRRARPSPRRRSVPARSSSRARPPPPRTAPFTLDGRYIVRFEQIAPEDPNLDFTGQTAFVAVLARHTQQADTGTKRLFRTAARTGRTEVTARGRYWIDVQFGDFPYAIRLTPTGRR